MLVPLYIKLMIITLNMSAFIALFVTSDPMTRTGRAIRYTTMCMVFLDILVMLRHAGMLDFH